MEQTPAPQEGTQQPEPKQDAQTQTEPKTETQSQPQSQPETQPETKPETKSWVNPDGTFNVDNAPDDVKDLIERKKYSSAEDIAKAYKGAEEKLGVPPDQIIKLPKDDDPEAWDGVYKKLGKPESPDKYEYTPPENSKVDIDDDLLNKFKEYAHKENLTNKQFNDTVQFQVDAMQAMQEQQQQQYEQSKEELRKQFKTEDEYNQFTQKAMGMAEKLGAFETLKNKGLEHDPEILKMFSSLADNISEDAVPSQQDTAQPSKEERINQIKQSDAFKQRLHPEHNKVMQEYWGLLGIGGNSK